MDLHTECKRGELSKLKQVCEKLKLRAESADFYRADQQGLFPLDILVINDKFECCKYLIENFNVDALRINAIGQSAFSYAIDLGRLQILKFLLENSKLYQTKRTRDDMLSALHCNKLGQCAYEVYGIFNFKLT